MAHDTEFTVVVTYSPAHLIMYNSMVLTFLTGGFTMKSSYGSSGFTVVKFSCRIEIFFSLSQPAGLARERIHVSTSAHPFFQKYSIMVTGTGTFWKYLFSLPFRVWEKYRKVLLHCCTLNGTFFILPQSKTVLNEVRSVMLIHITVKCRKPKDQFPGSPYSQLQALQHIWVHWQTHTQQEDGANPGSKCTCIDHIYTFKTVLCEVTLQLKNCTYA